MNIPKFLEALILRNICERLLVCTPLLLLLYISWVKTANIFMLKVNNRNTRKRCVICSKLTMKTPERYHWCRSDSFIIMFEHISRPFLVFLLLTWNTKTLARNWERWAMLELNNSDTARFFNHFSSFQSKLIISLCSRSTIETLYSQSHSCAQIGNGHRFCFFLKLNH